MARGVSMVALVVLAATAFLPWLHADLTVSGKAPSVDGLDLGALLPHHVAAKASLFDLPGNWRSVAWIVLGTALLGLIALAVASPEVARRTTLLALVAAGLADALAYEHFIVSESFQGLGVGDTSAGGLSITVVTHALFGCYLGLVALLVAGATCWVAGAAQARPVTPGGPLRVGAEGPRRVNPEPVPVQVIPAQALPVLDGFVAAHALPTADSEPRPPAALPTLEVAAPSAAPGWYPDPMEASLQRYWDGASWTGHTAPR